MLSHVSLGVSDLPRSIAFYDAALRPLGVVRVWSHADAVGYGIDGGPDRLALFEHRGVGDLAAGPGFHLAFFAANEAAVVEFHRNAVAAGGQDRGAPGPRPGYGPGYFAAFVLDPDGHKLEAKVGREG